MFAGDTYLTFLYEDAERMLSAFNTYQSIQIVASLCHWEDLNITPEWIDLGGEG